jgi:hypothetical protein
LGEWLGPDGGRGQGPREGGPGDAHPPCAVLLVEPLQIRQAKGLQFIGLQLDRLQAAAGSAGGWLEWVASVHVAAAYAFLMFIIIHVYLLTTGHSFIDHVKPMITGWDDVDLSPEEEAYLLLDEPGRIR